MIATKHRPMRLATELMGGGPNDWLGLVQTLTPAPPTPDARADALVPLPRRQRRSPQRKP